MTVRGPFAAACLLALAAAPVYAPAYAPAYAQAPTSLFPSRPSVPGAPDAAPALPSNLLGVESLQAVGGDSFGLRDGAEGLGADLWRGARHGQLVELMTLLPDATPSATMNALGQRLLVTSAAVPPAPAGAEASYLAVRLDRLAALGDAALAADLARAAPGRAQDKPVVRAIVDAAFLGGEHEAGCAEVRGAINAFADDPYWREALGFCQMIAGERAQAEITAAALREQKLGDAAFFPLLAAIGGDRNAKPASLAAPKPLHVAMLRAAKLAAPADAFESNDAAVLAALVQLSGPQLPEGALDARLAAAERAEAYGALPATVLIKLYEELRFTQAQLANALTGSESESGPRARALLYAAQARQGAAAARAVLIQRALVLSQDAGLLPTASRVYADALAGIPPTSDLAWFAASATRALFAAGRIREGRAWLAALGGGLGGGVGGTASGAQETPPAVALLPYALITAEPRGVPTWDPDLWRRWKQAQGAAMPTRASLLLTLLEGLGRPAPEEAWDGLARAQTDRADHLPAPSVLRTLEVSAATDRKGLAVLAALATFGPAGPAGTHPLVIGMALAGLRNIGLEAEARALAVDAAVGAGL